MTNQLKEECVMSVTKWEIDSCVYPAGHSKWGQPLRGKTLL